MKKYLYINISLSLIFCLSLLQIYNTITITGILIRSLILTIIFLYLIGKLQRFVKIIYLYDYYKNILPNSSNLRLFYACYNLTHQCDVYQVNKFTLIHEDNNYITYL